LNGVAANHFPERTGVCDSSQMPDCENRAGERLWQAVPAGTQEALTRDFRPPNCKHC
jgi:hypothetical protein